MTNHFHLLIETPEGNLGQGMRYLNSAYSQFYNRQHGLVGHVMQGRYKAILVQKDGYLLELARYIVLNPVRAGVVSRPVDWEWSSYRFTLGDEPAPPWLAVEWLLAYFSLDQARARLAYQKFVAEGMGLESPLKKVCFQCLLGDKSFIVRHRKAAEEMMSREVAKEQRRAMTMSLDEYAQKFAPREVAMAEAYRSTSYSMGQIAAYFAVSTKTVSRAVAAMERAAFTDRAADS